MRRSAPNGRPFTPVSNAARSIPSSIFHVSSASSRFVATGPDVTSAPPSNAVQTALVRATAVSRMRMADRGRATSPQAASVNRSTATVRAEAPSLRMVSVALDDSIPKSIPDMGETLRTPDQSHCRSEATSSTSPSETVDEE